MSINNKELLLIKEESLQPLINETIEDLFWDIAKIRLRRCEHCDKLSEELCSVYTTFSGGYQIRFVFCAELGMMKRIAENIAEEPVDDKEYIEEYMKEFLNIICGHVVASVFRKTKKTARFHCPCFEGRLYIPEAANARGTDQIMKTQYIDDYAENALLMNDKIAFITC